MCHCVSCNSNIILKLKGERRFHSSAAQIAVCLNLIAFQTWRVKLQRWNIIPDKRCQIDLFSSEGKESKKEQDGERQLDGMEEGSTPSDISIPKASWQRFVNQMCLCVCEGKRVAKRPSFSG